MIYDVCHEVGGMSVYEWRRDPKRIGFILARYKFVSKMLAGKKAVLEVGCADGFGARLVRQTVGRLTAIDIDPLSISEAIEGNKDFPLPIEFLPADFMSYSFGDMVDATYCLDVIEHIPPARTAVFLSRLSASAPVCIIGTPSLESQQYASALSKIGHVNCMSGEELQKLCGSYWPHVFMFGMNDEVLHTGFMPMSHYLFALCVH